MDDAAQQWGAHGDVDHGLGAVEALLVIADEATPADHPFECALQKPSTRREKR